MIRWLQRMALPGVVAGVVVFGTGLQAQKPAAEPKPAEAGEKEEKAHGRGRTATEAEKLTVIEALKRQKVKLPEGTDLTLLRVIEEESLKPCSIPLLPLRPTAKGSIRSVEPPPGPDKIREIDPPAPSCDDF